MAKYTVRHALLQYPSKNAAGAATFETAFRNMSIELKDGPETDRLVELGAVVPDGQELARPGRMLGLPETATDAEILNWVAGATTPEVTELVAARPAMAGRLLSAQEAIGKRFEAQSELLGQAAKQAEAETVEVPGLGAADNSGGVTPAPQPSTTAEPAVNSPGEALNPAPAAGLEGGTLADAEADAVVAKGAREAADYISENPQHASAVLAAEGRRDGGARPTVVKAAEAATAFRG